MNADQTTQLRLASMELAVRSGATTDNLVTKAEEIYQYLLLDLKAAEARKKAEKEGLSLIR